jgi:hypothetical protein
MRAATPLPSPKAPVGLGRHHALLGQHLTNMTAMQVQVCTLAITEYDELVERVVLLETENAALLRQLADRVLAKQKSTPPPARMRARANGNGAHR